METYESPVDWLAQLDKDWDSLARCQGGILVWVPVTNDYSGETHSWLSTITPPIYNGE